MSAMEPHLIAWTIYGTCETCGSPRTIRTEEKDGTTLVELICPVCDA